MSAKAVTVRQLGLAQAKVRAIVFDPDLRDMSSGLVVTALMAVAAEIAMMNLPAEEAHEFMRGLMAVGFANVERPVMQ